MKNKNLILVAAISLMAMTLASCNKDITLQEIGQESAGTISVSVEGLMGEYAQGDETKSGLVSTTRVSWSANDKVYVYDGANYLGALTVSLKDGKDYYAVLTGVNITEPQSGTTKLTLIHSNSFTSNPEISNGKVAVDISTQAGSTTPKDIPFVAFATLDYNSGTPEINGQIADFSLATSLMRLNCSGLEANAAITGATLKGVSNECVLNITKDGVTIGEGNMGDINISFTGVSASSKGAQTLYAAVAQNNSASKQGLIITQTGKSAYSFGSKAREAGKAVNAICQMERWCIPGMYTVNAEGKRVIFSYGNLWADATDPENPVFKFENNQYDFSSTWSKSHVSHFIWSTFAKEAIKEDVSYEGEYSVNDVLFTNSSKESANPNFTVEDQTGKYRTLSENEWDYLLNERNVNGGSGEDKSYSLNITYNGNKGLVLYPDDFKGPVLSADTQYTSENFPIDCVFLPTAGIRLVTDFSSVGESGSYHLSSFAGDNQFFLTQFGSDSVFIGTCPYICCNSVRLVTDVK